MGDDGKIKDSEEVGAVTRGSLSRRGLLVSLCKWSKIVVGVAIGGGALLTKGKEAYGGAWVNRGGAWANRAGGGGAWANRGGAWANRGGAWANRGGAWVNRF